MNSVISILFKPSWRPWRTLSITLSALALSGGCNDRTSTGPNSFTNPDALGATQYSLTTFDSCVDAEADLKSRLLAKVTSDLEARRHDLIEYGYYNGGGRGGMEVGDVILEDAGEPAMDAAEGDFDSATAESAPSASNGTTTVTDQGGDREEGVDYSGTNNQEEGVDEADFVKTDGDFIYVVSGNTLNIFAVPVFGDIEARGTLELPYNPREMLLAGDEMVLFSTISPWGMNSDDPLREEIGFDDGSYRYSNYTRVDTIALDASRMTPTIGNSVLIEGSYSTARHHSLEEGDRVMMVSHAQVNIPGVQSDIYIDLYNMDRDQREAIVDTLIDAMIEQNEIAINELSLEDVVPGVWSIEGNAMERFPFDESDCQNVAAVVDGVTHSMTSLLTLGLDDNGVSVSADHIMSNYPTVYASNDVIVIAESSQPQWWYYEDAPEDATNLHRFDIDGSTTTYSGSGQVPGQIIGQFALSEHDGDIRVATTRNLWSQWWDEEQNPISNWLFILNGENELETKGSVGPLAEGETIWSARFKEDTAYIVTFRQTDPLWVIDIADADNPMTLGELHIPGVSTYIHPIEDDNLLTIGIPGDESGRLEWGQDRISLFDVSDRSNPTQVTTLDIGEEYGWGYSEARNDHRAFQYFNNMLAIPRSQEMWVEVDCDVQDPEDSEDSEDSDEGGSDGVAGEDEVSSGSDSASSSDVAPPPDEPFEDAYNDGECYPYTRYFNIAGLQLIDVEPGASLSSHGALVQNGIFNPEQNGGYCYYGYAANVRRSIFMGDFIYAISPAGITVHRIDDLEQVAMATTPLHNNNYGYDCYYY